MPSSNSRSQPPPTMVLNGKTVPIPQNEFERLNFLVALAINTEREDRLLRERMTAIEGKISKLASQVQNRGACEDTDFHRDSGIALHDEFITTNTTGPLTQASNLTALAAIINPLASGSITTSTLGSTSVTDTPAIEKLATAVKAPAAQKIASLFTPEDEAAFPAGPVNFPGFKMPSACMAVPKEKVIGGMATNMDRERVLRETPAKGWISMADMESIIKQGIVIKDGGKTVAEKAVEGVPGPALDANVKKVDGKEKKWKSWMKKSSTD